jgi:hypothetical protein
MKAHSPLLLTAFLVACVASKGLLLTEVTKLKAELKNTMESQAIKLKERKLAVVSSRRLDSGLSQSQAGSRVPRYLKPTPPRQLKDLKIKKVAATIKQSNKNLIKAHTSPKIDRYLKPNQPRNLANEQPKPAKLPLVTPSVHNAPVESKKNTDQNRSLGKKVTVHHKKISHKIKKIAHKKVVRKSAVVQKKKNAASVLKQRIAKAKAASLRAKNLAKLTKAKKAIRVAKAVSKKSKVALKTKKANKTKRVTKAKQVLKAKRVVKRNKKIVRVKKSRHLETGLNDSDNKLLEELSKKVKAMKEKNGQPSDSAAKPANEQKPTAPARKLKTAAAQERNLLDLPSQEEFYSSIVNDYSSRF